MRSGAASLQREVKRRAYRLLPLALLRRLVPRDVIGLHYHVVSDRPLPYVRHLYHFKTPEQFGADLRYLQQHFRLLSYPELVEAGPSEPGAKPRAILTFDDGYRECFSVVRPMLLARGIPCTFFVTTGLLDNARAFHRNLVSLCIERTRSLTEAEADVVIAELWEEDGGPDGRVGLEHRLRGLDREGPEVDRACARLGVDAERFLREERPYLTREEVRTLHADGFAIGAHTRTHPILRASDPPAWVEREIAGSCYDVRELTGEAQVPFAFPVRGGGVDRDFLEEIRARHPTVGLVFDTGRLRRDRDFVVHRIPVERPLPAAPPGFSNLPDHLRRAYVNQGVRSLRQAVAGIAPAALRRPR